MRIAALGLVLGLAPFLPACRSPGGSSRADAAASVSAPAPAPAPAPSIGIAWREAGRWTSAEGVEWRAIVVPKDASHGALMRLAHRLHVEQPTTFFDLFDDDAELAKLVVAGGDDDALPHAWREAHEIATIAGSVGSANGAVTVSDVKLFEWKTMETTPVK